MRFSKEPETLQAQKSTRKVPENNFGCFSKRPWFSGPEENCSFPEKFYGCLRAPEKSVNKSRESSVNKKMAAVGALLTTNCEKRKYRQRTVLTEMMRGN